MAFMASQVIAYRLSEFTLTTDWILLTDACVNCLRSDFSTMSEADLREQIEDRIRDVAEDLRNRASEAQTDGNHVTYEIDTTEPTPFVRGTVSADQRNMLDRLKRLDPFDFEILCSDILSKLGAIAQQTPKTHDGGVDFLGFNFAGITAALPFPLVSKSIVVGQAKRYTRAKMVSESEVQKFVGGALRQVEKYRDRDDFGILSPVVFAYWTTHDFEPNARKYAKAMGIWTMNGPTLAAYVLALQLDNRVDELLTGRSATTNPTEAEAL